MKKRVVSLLLSSVMALSLAACGQSASTGTEAPATTSDGTATETAAPADTSADASATAEQTDKASGERQTISWSVIDVNAGVNATGEYADQIMQQIEDFCGADLDIIWYANDALSEKNSLALTSPSTMPQIMSWGGTVTGDVVSAAKN